MSKRTWGLVAGIIGSAVGAWYVNSQRRSAAARAARALTPARDHGTVIFDNTPTPTHFEENL